ncbi:MAG TPA: hypothetical protein VE956_03820 [Nodularia sp. (in: cyanobacteria)]|nr:hypothetical protein [Nodularia sp. (in: cyanobacteria)]
MLKEDSEEFTPCKHLDRIPQGTATSLNENDLSIAEIRASMSTVNF